MISGRAAVLLLWALAGLAALGALAAAAGAFAVLVWVARAIV